MKILLLVVTATLALALLAGLVLYLAGRRLPVRHTSRLTLLLPAARLAVWNLLTDYTRMPEWWPAVKTVRLESRPGGEIWAWTKDAHGQEIAFRTKEEKVPSRLIREIMGDHLPFGGTWTFELAEEGANTRLTLTEDGFIRPPLFRAVARYFIGLDRTMKDFAVNLEKRLAGAR
jgi:uncharacterized protein YndB with AHSA1/START domain